jgi:hypothetical protein
VKVLNFTVIQSVLLSALQKNSKLSNLMIETVIIYNLWQVSFIFMGLVLFQFYLDFTWFLAYRGVKAPISGQVQITKFSIDDQFQYKNFFSSSFELFMIVIVNWNKLNLRNFIIDQICNYEHFVKNYGYFPKLNIIVKIQILQFSTFTFNIFQNFII